MVNGWDWRRMTWPARIGWALAIVAVLTFAVWMQILYRDWLRA